MMEHQATQPPTTLLDITKLLPAVLATVLMETSDSAKEKQAQVDAIEHDPSMSREERSDMIHQLMNADLRFVVDLHNSNDDFGQFMHGAAHQMIDKCNELAKREGACKTVVFSFAQMVCLGWRLAEAHLQNLSLEQSVQ